MQTAETQAPISLRAELGNEFVRRCKKNAKYSMRAYAQFLDIDQSLLSKILNGQRRISVRQALNFANKLQMKPSAVQLILETLNVDSSVLTSFAPMADDQFNLLSDWCHFAILELIKTKDFVLDPKWMAQRLGIHTQEVQDALERLARLKFLEIKGTKVNLLKPNNTWPNTEVSSRARQVLQKTMLEKALAATQEVPFELRENGSLTVAVDISRMAEFKKKLMQVRRELDAFFQPADPNSNFNEVYQLTMAFFPITQNLKKNKSKREEV